MSDVDESQADRVRRQQQVLERADPLALELLGVLALVNLPLTEDQWLIRSTQRGVKGPGGRPLQRRDVLDTIASLGQLGISIAGEHHRGVEPRVSPEVLLELFRLLHARGRLGALFEAAAAAGPVYSHLSIKSPWEAAAETAVRVGIVRDNPSEIANGCERGTRYARGRAIGVWMIGAIGIQVEERVLALLPERQRDAFVAAAIEFALVRLIPPSDAVIARALAIVGKPVQLAAARLLVLLGETERALSLAKLPKLGRQGLELLAAFWAPDRARALAVGDSILAATANRKQKALAGLEGACWVLAALATGDPARLTAAGSVLAGMSSKTEGVELLTQIHAGFLGERSGLRPRAHAAHSAGSWLDAWLGGLQDAWFDLRPGPEYMRRSADEGVQVMRDWAAHCARQGFPAIAREFEGTADALAKMHGKQTAASPDATTLVSSVRVPDAWQAALMGLEAIAEQAQQVALEPTDAARRRIVWEFERGHIQPRLVSGVPRKSGTLGKKISRASRRGGAVAESLTDEDRRVLAAAEPEHPDEPWRRPSMVLGPRAMVALIGHSGVVAPDGRTVKFERGRPKLRTQRKAGKVQVDLIPTMLLVHDVAVVQTDPTRVLVYERTPELARAAEILGRGLVVPKTGVEQLSRVLTRLSMVAGIEVGGDLEPEAEQVECDPRPLLLLEWDGETLLAHARVAPLGLAGAHVPPGVGHVSISAELHEAGRVRLVRGERDLGEERRRLADFASACPTLMSFAEGQLDFRVSTIADALEVMTELGRLGDAVMLAWPKGRTLHPPVVRELGDLRLTVTSSTAWLEIEAGVEIDEGVLLSFRELIDARAGTRFVALGNDRFVALSEQLRRRIDALQDLGSRKGASVRTTAAMLSVLEELAGDLDEPQFDAESLARLSRLREVAAMRPRLPRGFRATLRDYQRDGYAWLWRLAEVGLGACLADDMGLGKTVQTLALLLARASKGPALVVCPTSVVHNWVAEAARFCPGLRTSVLASADDRAALLAASGRNDVIVCSYGVLAGESEALAEVEFATAVFDEAHALKNDDTKRAKAAQSIRAGFRVGLTGTPVENRVEELWGVFRVLVPGLLGGKSHFDERFAKPIAKGQREHAATLRAIVRPFILRRTKSQVLDELPPRTEITMVIPPNPAEQAYYEALRRRAVEKLEAGDPRKKRFRVLAEITRLRQAAIVPRLLDAEAAPAGAKLDAALEHVLALREEGHRALLFTQFLGSIALLRERFEAAGIEYLELEGSTPAAERARRVDAFQRGEGDVFLLSLRAGGVGMNLTGADYVLHLDPWWNPAVEDQATDRAHRIGQTRPVTVYRLVTQGTIEEKILALHERKRGLADDLLSGLEGGDVLDLDELMQLLG